jgi:hypothetical protein
LTLENSFSDISYASEQGGKARLKFTLNRSGNRSSYGDFRVTCNASGGDFVAFYLRGIAVYPEVDRRFMEHSFDIPQEQAQNCRRVLLEYEADVNAAQFGGKLLASSTASM